MTSNQYLKTSSILALVAFILLMAALTVANTGIHPASQEIFEVIASSQSYTAALKLAEPNLRIVLFIDAIFALFYTSAICFAAIGFHQRNPPIAYAAIIGIIIIMFLDYAENIMMGQSMDLLAIGADITTDRIVSQVSISSIKWHGAAAVLFTISFLLPSDNIVEKLLVWGTRIGLAIAVPLFVTNAFDLRETGGLFILLSMASGFVLLSLVTWNRSKME